MSNSSDNIVLRGEATNWLPDPNPRFYRQQLPTGVRRALEEGLIDEREVWRRCERLLGAVELARQLEHRSAE